MTTEQAILATLAYHDIFDYPLTIREIHRYIINYQTPQKAVEKNVNVLLNQHKIGERRGFYFLKNRSMIVSTRLKRQKYSIPKLKKAQFFAQILKFIPTVKLVAISGALSMGNSHKDDDIDLVIVSQKDLLWTTRFLTNVVLLPFKRTPLKNTSQVVLSEVEGTPPGWKQTNRACLNVFLDESDLKINPQNLYTAHEICQMKPLWDRNETYSQFIKANSWVKKFLPNWAPTKMESGKWPPARGLWPAGKIENRGHLNFHLPLTINYSPVENFLKKFQLWYMRPKITTEKVGDTQLFFHPKSTQDWVLNEYQKLLQKFGISNANL
ncbi:hypothetical protein HYU92_02470 [Candidatus Curtissbacteria bacterium]|nr:hypothetical protein [Candidatus Curtissbacteria bacterium]